jgi:hypothetical protein
MAVRKTIEIDGTPVAFQASAATPRLYRNLFKRDIFDDMDKLMSSVKDQDPESSKLDVIDLELFENVAFTMARQADPSVPDDVMQWLDGFEMFSIYAILPHILELWGINMETMSDAKKKRQEQTEN